MGNIVSDAFQSTAQQLQKLVLPQAGLEENLAREILRENFFGAAQWRVAFDPQEVDIGRVPRLPARLTPELLDSPCPFHDEKKVRQTHVLALIPSHVNKAPLTPLKLVELCRGQRVFDALASNGNWEQLPFASINLSRARWVLMPKGLDTAESEAARSLFGLDVQGQEEVLDRHFASYREITAVELFSCAALYCLINGKGLFGDNYLRCNDESLKGGRICFGRFNRRGFVLKSDDKPEWDFHNVGRAVSYNL